MEAGEAACESGLQEHTGFHCWLAAAGTSGSTAEMLFGGRDWGQGVA
jgi:hypothetical protein